MKTIVSLSADNIRDYAFVLPLTALFWRDVIGFEPMTMLIGDFTSSRNRIVLEGFESLNIPYHLLGTHIGDSEGRNIESLQWANGSYQTCTIAQNVREHAAAVIEDNDVWLMPGDADLWPFKQEFFKQHLRSDIEAACYYYNGDNFQSKDAVLSAMSSGRDYQTIPTCHVAMKVLTWKEMYNYSSSDIMKATVSTLDKWLIPKTVGKIPSQASWECWMSDQRILTENLCKADWFPSKVALIQRNGHPPADRLDRGNISHWHNVNPSRWTDTHLLRAPDDNWPLIRPIISHYLPQYVEWADNYKNKYTAA
jgi:hypothetical protein